MSLDEVIRSSRFVYVGGVVTNILGFVFWFIAARFVPPDVVGSVSAIIAIQVLLMSIMSLGLPTGVKRFIGERRGKKDYSKLSSYFTTNLAMMILLNVPVSLVLLLAPLLQFSGSGLTSIELGFVGLLMLLSFWTPTFVSLFDSLLRTQVTAFAQTTSAVVKLTLGTILLLLGFGFLGVLVAFIVAAISVDVILLLKARMMFRELGCEPTLKPKLIRHLVTAGFPAWVPNILTMAGQSLAVLFVYGVVGGTDAGLYYLAFAIASVVYALPTSIQGLMYPVLSGMEEGREEFILRTTRISLLATAPAALAIAAYSTLPFTLLGPEYSAAAILLTMIVMGAALWPIYSGYYGYVYATKRYRHVLALGTVLNGSRLVLYLAMITSFGAFGIAASFTGSIILALVAMVASASKIDFKPEWSTYAQAIAIPASILLVLSYLTVVWFLAIPIVFALSFVAYGRLGFMTREDIFEVLVGIFSKQTAVRFLDILGPISRVVFGEQNRNVESSRNIQS